MQHARRGRGASRIVALCRGRARRHAFASCDPAGAVTRRRQFASRRDRRALRRPRDARRARMDGRAAHAVARRAGARIRASITRFGSIGTQRPKAA
jgi:hypothetical protein